KVRLRCSHCEPMLMATCLIMVSSWPDQVRGKTTGFLTARFPFHNELANSSPCAPEGQEDFCSLVKNQQHRIQFSHDGPATREMGHPGRGSPGGPCASTPHRTMGKGRTGRHLFRSGHWCAHGLCR